MFISNKNIDKYLKVYAEPESKIVSQLNIKTQYQAALAIPAFDESADFLQRLPQSTKLKYLVILVINRPLKKQSNLDSSAIKNSRTNTNQLLFTTIKNTFSLSSQAQNLYYFCSQTNAPHPSSNANNSESKKKITYDLLVVDRFNHGLEIEQDKGVGQARKIAADIACALIQRKNIISPWIYSTDADVILASDYFNYLEQLENTTASAIVFPFQHCNSKQQQPPLSMLLYELSLNYYVHALAWAGSSYAYHTLGSCLAVHYQSYAAVRGFPKRSAGEDFYILNKLNKIDPVFSLNTKDVEAIKIFSRHSQRVPFGTGPAVIKIDQLINPIEDYLYYHPTIFNYLKAFLCILKTIKLDSSKQTVNSFILHNCQTLKLYPNLITNALAENQFYKNLKKLQNNSTSNTQLNKQLTHWFDAFKTLKFLHAIEKSHNTEDNQQPYHKINLAQLVSDKAPASLDFMSANQLKIKVALRELNIDQL